jgi:hypothetical protein
MDTGVSVALRGKAQVNISKISVGGQGGGKWTQASGWDLTGQVFAKVDSGVIKIDEKKNIKFGFPWGGLVLSTDKSLWYNLGAEWANILGLGRTKVNEEIIQREVKCKK